MIYDFENENLLNFHTKVFIGMAQVCSFSNNKRVSEFTFNLF